MGVRVPKTKKTEASKALERSATTISPNSIKYETPPSVFWDWQEDEPQLMNNASSLKTRIGQTLCILNLLRDRTRLLSTPLVQSVIAEDREFLSSIVKHTKAAYDTMAELLDLTKFTHTSEIKIQTEGWEDEKGKGGEKKSDAAKT